MILDTILQWPILDPTVRTPSIHTERIQMKFAFQMDSPPSRPYGTRIKYISHECTLQDYYSSYEMEFQVYIYIYIYQE